MTANILIVDDLEANIKVLEVKLLNEYYTVFTANSGKMALEILGKQKIDIVLLDVMMPEMDGFEVCKKIKTNPVTAYIPVIMVTALSDVEDKVKGLEAGADDFLTKPINDLALFTQVKSLSRIKSITDELMLRNLTNSEFSDTIINFTNDFSESKIAIINNDLPQVKHLQKIFESLTKQIYIINNPTDLNNLEQLSPDIIIISSGLGENDPLRICSILKSKVILIHSIFIFQIEEEELNMVIKAMEIGINDYFIYPINTSELIARIKTQLRKKFYHDKLRLNLDQKMNDAIKDSLTNCYNRRYFETHLHHLINQPNNITNFGLLMMDIDHFKLVNDQYGHQAGDKLLKDIAQLIINTLRITDLIARYGGEEFVVILKDLTQSDAIVIAEHIKILIESTTFHIDAQNTISKTISIGLAMYNHDESGFELIRKADEALYQAKAQGRNCIKVA